jgi:hypothetical protein
MTRFGFAAAAAGFRVVEAVAFAPRVVVRPDRDVCVVARAIGVAPWKLVVNPRLSLGFSYRSSPDELAAPAFTT